MVVYALCIVCHHTKVLSRKSSPFPCPRHGGVPICFITKIALHDRSASFKPECISILVSTRRQRVFPADSSVTRCSSCSNRTSGRAVTCFTMWRRCIRRRGIWSTTPSLPTPSGPYPSRRKEKASSDTPSSTGKGEGRFRNKGAGWGRGEGKVVDWRSGPPSVFWLKVRFCLRRMTYLRMYA